MWKRRVEARSRVSQGSAVRATPRYRPWTESRSPTPTYDTQEKGTLGSGSARTGGRVSWPARLHPAVSPAKRAVPQKWLTLSQGCRGTRSSLSLSEPGPPESPRSGAAGAQLQLGGTSNPDIDSLSSPTPPSLATLKARAGVQACRLTLPGLPHPTRKRAPSHAILRKEWPGTRLPP